MDAGMMQMMEQMMRDPNAMAQMEEMMGDPSSMKEMFQDPEVGHLQKQMLGIPKEPAKPKGPYEDRTLWSILSPIREHKR